MSRIAAGRQGVWQGWVRCLGAALALLPAGAGWAGPDAPATTPAAGPPPYIAGLVPDRRPEGAPAITRFEATPEGRARALRGIPGTPDGLGFLDAQGAWYTPFDQPGMPAPYDLRGLHAGAGKGGR